MEETNTISIIGIFVCTANKPNKSLEGSGMKTYIFPNPRRLRGKNKSKVSMRLLIYTIYLKYKRDFDKRDFNSSELHNEYFLQSVLSRKLIKLVSFQGH